MAAIVTLSEPNLSVEPGGVASLEVRVRNTGSAADQFSFIIEGQPASFATVTPGALTLFPGAEGAVTVRFTPARAANVPAGPLPFAIRVESREDASAVAVENGTINVSGFRELAADVVPRSSRGRRSARHDVIIENRGNARISASLSAVDPNNLLAFSFDPAGIAADAGTTTYSRVRVAARKRSLTGPSASRPFQVLVETDNSPPIAIDATFQQEPMLSGGVLGSAIAVVVAAVLLVVLWLGVVRPEIRRSVKRTVATQLAKQGGRVVPSGGGTSSSGGGATLAGTPIDGRLFLKAAGQTSFEVPSGKTLSLTDVILENPAGNTGTLQMQRDGTSLLVVGLDNFRDLDYHFVSPIVFTAGQKLQLVASCTSVGCTPGAYFAGTLASSST